MPRCIEKTFASINVALTAKGKTLAAFTSLSLIISPLCPLLSLMNSIARLRLLLLFPPFASFHNAAQTHAVAKARTRQSERAASIHRFGANATNIPSCTYSIKTDPTRLFIALANGSARTAKSFAPTNVANTTCAVFVVVVVVVRE